MKRLLTITCVIFIFACEDGSDLSPLGNLSGSGTGGSLASFLVTGNNLYVLSGDKLMTYNIGQGEGLTFTSSLKLPSLLETVYPFENYLFLGSNNAVYFLDLSNGDFPTWVSSYEHVTACDPVVARNGLAYSTIRNTNCRGNISTIDFLDVIDISDLESPTVVSSQMVQNPYGLAITQDFLFVCENEGVTVYDTRDPSSPSKKFTNKLEGIAHDIIPREDYLIIVTSKGVFNVTYNSQGEFTVIGEITD